MSQLQDPETGEYFGCVKFDEEEEKCKLSKDVKNYGDATLYLSDNRHPSFGSFGKVENFVVIQDVNWFSNRNFQTLYRKTDY